MSWRNYLKRGIAAEKAFANLLAENVHGLFITHIEAGAGATKGPRVRGADFGETKELPDNDIHAIFNDVHFHIQLKLKTKANYRINGDYYEHGIDMKAYYGYKDLYEYTYTPMLLVFWEERSPHEGPEPDQEAEILAEWFHRLPEPRLYKGPNFVPMMNWNRKSFDPIVDSSSLEFFILADGRQAIFVKLEKELSRKRYVNRPIIFPPRNP